MPLFFGVSHASTGEEMATYVFQCSNKNTTPFQNSGVSQPMGREIWLGSMTEWFLVFVCLFETREGTIPTISHRFGVCPIVWILWSAHSKKLIISRTFSNLPNGFPQGARQSCLRNGSWKSTPKTLQENPETIWDEMMFLQRCTRRVVDTNKTGWQVPLKRWRFRFFCSVFIASLGTQRSKLSRVFPSQSFRSFTFFFRLLHSWQNLRCQHNTPTTKHDNSSRMEIDSKTQRRLCQASNSN